MHIGVVVNPIAGMGGRVGLKGTDGKAEQARERGAQPRAPERAIEALEALSRHAPTVSILAAAGVMGADAARAAGFDPAVVYEPADGPPDDPARPGTTAADTREAVRAFVDHGVDLVLFVGGDGTAVDVAETLEDLGVDTPMLGVPAGVKVYSSVFGVTPADAGRIAGTFESVADREVNDIDEAAYREGEVRSELRAVRPVPVAEAVQSSKQVGRGSVEAVVEGFLASVEPNRTYVFGPGGTVGAIEDALGIDGSPLGVDVWRAAERDRGSSDPPAGELLVRDASESEILSNLSEDNVVVVSPIGGQGFLFGRGNHQISPAVIRQSDIEVVAAPDKLADLGVLRVDTDDEALDDSLRGWIRVRSGRYEQQLLKVV